MKICNIDTHRLKELCDTEGANKYPLGTLGKPTMQDTPWATWGAHRRRQGAASDGKGMGAGRARARAQALRATFPHVPATTRRTCEGGAHLNQAAGRKEEASKATHAKRTPRRRPRTAHGHEGRVACSGTQPKGRATRGPTEGRAPPTGLAGRGARRPLPGLPPD